jgi:hypothetical protein
MNPQTRQAMPALMDRLRNFQKSVQAKIETVLKQPLKHASTPSEVFQANDQLTALYHLNYYAGLALTLYEVINLYDNLGDAAQKCGINDEAKSHWATANQNEEVLNDVIPIVNQMLNEA